MKPLQIDRDIVPMGDLKAHASRIFRRLREEGRPIVITWHGRPAGVLVPTGDFDRMNEQVRFLAAVHQGLAESEIGSGLSDDELGTELDREFGPLSQP